MKWMGKGAGKGLSLGLVALALGAVALTSQLRADDAGQAAGGAARLSSVEGQVRISQGGQVLADPALVNTPLFAGTQIETGDDGKAEIQFDDGSVARLSPDSALTLTAISNGGVTQISMDGGLGYFELQGNGPGGDTRIIFGDAVATASGFTVMRVKLDTPPGELAVFSGNAHLQRGNALAVDLRGGESIALTAGDAGKYNLAETIEPDSWDAWNSDRDQALNAQATDQTPATSNFTNSDGPNPQWNDLDANGNWYNVPGQGYVWSPYEASSAGWDPYGCGHWMWTPRFGYIWVSCESWGYLPYSMGAWTYYDGFGWGWRPGVGGPWWGHGGGYRGVNIINGPRDYHPAPMPTPRGPIGRQVPRIVTVNRDPGNHGGEGLPVRSRNSPVEIGGLTVQPLRPTPSHQRYEPGASGFVYRPAQGRPTQGDAGAGGANYGFRSPGGSNTGSTPSHRDSYTPGQGPQHVGVPRLPAATHNDQPSTSGAPGANYAAPTQNGPTDTGRPASGGQVPRNYYQSRPASGVDRFGNGSQAAPQPASGGQPAVRPTPAPAPTYTRPAPAPTYNRPANNGGGQASPRPSSGGGGGSPAPASHGGGGGGGGAPHNSGGGGPHGGNVH